MNRHQLTDALLDEERHTPDPAAVLSGVRTGIRRRRRRNRVVAVAALAAVAAVAVLFVVPRADSPVVVSDAPTATLRIRLTWLPPTVSATAPADVFSSSGYSGEYVTYGRSGSAPYLQANLDLSKTEEGSWTQATVNDRPARYQLLGRTIVVSWTLPSGRAAGLVYGSGGNQIPPEDLQRDALRAAAGLRDDGEQVLRAAVIPTYLPPGHQVAGVTSDGGLSLAPPGRSFPDYVITLRTPPPTTSPAAQPSDHSGLNNPVRIADIQGRPAYLTAGTIVTVPDFHGRTLQVSGQDDPSPATDEIIRVAEGLQWA